MDVPEGLDKGPQVRLREGPDWDSVEELAYPEGDWYSSRASSSWRRRAGLGFAASSSFRNPFMIFLILVWDIYTPHAINHTQSMSTATFSATSARGRVRA